MIFKWMIIGIIVVFFIILFSGGGFLLSIMYGVIIGAPAGIAFRKWIARTFWE